MDWPTGVRDYVHVWDLAAAHVAAIERFDSILTGTKRSIAINLGTGSGTTVRELCAAFNNVVDTPLDTVDTDPRPGDVAGGYTTSGRAAELLGWPPDCPWRVRSAPPWTGFPYVTGYCGTDLVFLASFRASARDVADR